MNILSVFILTLILGLVQATTYSQKGAENGRYQQLSDVPNTQNAYQHLPSQENILGNNKPGIYQNWLLNNRSPQLEHSASSINHNPVNALLQNAPLRNKEYILSLVNEPYNLPHQNEFSRQTNSLPNDVLNIPVTREPYRSNLQRQDIVSSNIQLIEPARESISIPQRNIDVSDSQSLSAHLALFNPKVREVLNTVKQNKRYMVIYPDGRISQVDNVESILETNPNHIFFDPLTIAKHSTTSSQNTENIQINDRIIQKTSDPNSSPSSDKTIQPTKHDNAPEMATTSVIVVQQPQLLQNKSKNLQPKIPKLNEEQRRTTLKSDKTKTENNHSVTAFNISNSRPPTDQMIREEKHEAPYNKNLSESATNKDNNKNSMQAKLDEPVIAKEGVNKEKEVKNPTGRIFPTMNDTNHADKIKNNQETLPKQDHNKTQKNSDLNIKGEKNEVPIKKKISESASPQNSAQKEKPLTSDTGNVEKSLEIINPSKDVSLEVDKKGQTRETQTQQKTNFEKIDVRKNNMKDSNARNGADEPSPNLVNNDTNNKKNDSPTSSSTKEDSVNSKIISDNETPSHNEDTKPLIVELQKNPTNNDENNDNSKITICDSSPDVSAPSDHDQNKSKDKGKNSDDTDDENQNTYNDSVELNSSSSEDYSNESSQFESNSSNSQDFDANTSNSSEEQDESISPDEDAWSQVTIENDDYELIRSYKMDLQPMTVVDSRGKSHACVRILDLTALYTYIICR